MDGLIALMIAATAMMGSPGPATLSSAAAGAAYRLRAVPYVIGISLGTMSVMVLVAVIHHHLLVGCVEFLIHRAIVEHECSGLVLYIFVP